MTPTPSGAPGPGLPALLPTLRDELKNRARRGLRRLRDPLYAAALAVGLAYFGWIFFVSGGGGARTPPAEMGRLLDSLRGLAPFLLAGIAGYWWLRGRYERALTFEPPEVQILFPAPLSRDTLLRYRLLKLQGGLLFSAAVLSVLPRGALPWPARLVSWWLLATTLHLHQIGSSLTRSDVARGRMRRTTTWIPVSLLVLSAAGLAATLWSALPDLRAAEGGQAFLVVLSRALDAPLPRVVLLPVEATLAPLFAADAASWLRSLPGALALLAAHYLWVVRAGSGLEDLALRGHRGRARNGELRSGSRGRPARSSLRRSPLPLPPAGGPSGALLWKNLTAFLRGIRTPMLVGALAGPPALAAAVAVAAGSWARGAAWTAAILALAAAGLALFGPLAFRYDLRRDLERIGLLRTLPIPGPRLVAAEVGAAALALTAVQAALLAAAGLLLPFAAETPVPRALLYGWGAAALVALPALNLLTLSIQNGLALLLPAWARIGRDHPGGVDHVGQSILTLTATLFLVFLALTPAILVGAVTAATAGSLAGNGAALLAGGGVALAAILAEVAVGLRWLGRRFDALDPWEAGLL